MNAQAFRRKVQALAQASRNVFIVAHARQRMVMRHHTFVDAVECLKKGVVVEGPFVNAKGHWQATFRRDFAGQSITVAAALETASDGEQVIVITVI